MVAAKNPEVVTTAIGECTAWHDIDGHKVLVQREDHFLSSWWRVYVRGQRQGKLHDYFLGTVSTGVKEAGPQIYSDSFYRCGLLVHSTVESAVLRLVDVFNRTEIK